MRQPSQKSPSSKDLPRKRVRSEAGARSQLPQVSHQESGNGAISLHWVAVADLQLSERRLAKANDRQHRQLMASIAEFGFITAIVIKGKEIVVGEARVRAARELGLTRVPAVEAGNLTDIQVRQFRIADNRLGELREWDPAALREEFEEIVLLDEDVNIEAMGYEVAEFDVALQVVDAGADPADQLDPPPLTSFIVGGQIWEADGHAILCGDARSPSDWIMVLGDAKPEVIIADPPWNFPVKSMGGKGAIKHPEFIMGSGEMAPDQFLAFQTDWIATAVQNLAPGQLIYIATDWRAQHTTATAALASGLEQINLCVWSKSPALGSMYRSAHELFLVYRVPGASHRNNIKLGAYGRFRSNCWNYPSASSFGRGREGLAIHPNSKPIALLSDILLDCTKRGDIVVDPFSGSGSTLIAAQRTGRIARVIELDPRYVEAAVRRYEQVFGRPMRLRGSGLTLADMKVRHARPDAGPAQIAKPAGAPPEPNAKPKRKCEQPTVRKGKRT